MKYSELYVKQVGEVFPKSPNQAVSFSSSSELSLIYSLVTENFYARIWSLQEFKDFRNAISRFSFSNMDYYQDLILFFLYLKDNQARNLILELDRDFNFHIFEKREKKIVMEKDLETGKETKKELYGYVRRSYQPGDICRVVDALVSGNLKMVIDYVMKTYFPKSISDSETLKISQMLLDLYLVEGSPLYTKISDLVFKYFSFLEGSPFREKVVKIETSHAIFSLKKVLRKKIYNLEEEKQRGIGQFQIEQAIKVGANNQKKKGKNYSLYAERQH